MPIERVGGLLIIGTRTTSQTTADSYPEPVAGGSDDGIAAVSGAIQVPSEARGAITHVLVNGQGTTLSCVIIVYGYLRPDGLVNTNRPNWWPLAALNGGAAISSASIAGGAASTKGINYSESFSHISAYPALYARVYSISAGTLTNIWFAFET